VIDQVFPVQSAQEAHESMRSYENVGKIVLAVNKL
jgi:NADPH:quinone reductase-like Zn-dependent oxidoreductase